jgi:hypothetical protein
MAKQIKLIGILSIDGDSKECQGNIEIIKRDDKVVYAIWRFLSQNEELIAAKGNNYFIGNKKKDISDLEIANLIIESILKYRIGRERIFSNVRIT